MLNQVYQWVTNGGAKQVVYSGFLVPFAKKWKMNIF